MDIKYEQLSDGFTYLLISFHYLLRHDIFRNIWRHSNGGHYTSQFLCHVTIEKSYNKTRTLTLGY